MEQLRIVATVGSTEFTSLISALLNKDTLQLLKHHSVLVQYGNSALPTTPQALQLQLPTHDFQLVKFLPDLELKVSQADIVISHAGAGSILSFLRPPSSNTILSDTKTSTAKWRKRTLILVPNSTLMDSHQQDLADEMKRKGWATVSDTQ
ncbi:hypothetical protein T439DRAFT_116918 [Meredithblackwellia eburnea MCA 4105]